jgi:hypothetical protein
MKKDNIAAEKLQIEILKSIQKDIRSCMCHCDKMIKIISDYQLKMKNTKAK